MVVGVPVSALVAGAATLGLTLSQPHVTARIATGRAPCEAAAAAGAVWVANDGGTLARVDPRTNRVTARIRTGRGSCAVAAGAGAIWVVNYRTGLLLRVDLRTRKVRRVMVGGAPFDVVVAYGSVWVTGFDNGRLVEVDARTARVTRRIKIGGAPTGLLNAAGAIWVGLGRAATQVLRVDPGSGRARRIDVGLTAPTHFVAARGAIWVVNDGDALARLDPGDGHVLKVTHVGRTLVQPALAPDGTLWVPDKETDAVFRLDPATGRVVDSFPSGNGAFQALRAFGSMWVTSYAGTSVWRFSTGR
jgi:streptogramin lyase